MDTQENSLNWFELPVSDIERATSFYENIFNISMARNSMNGMEMSFFPYEPESGKAAGGLAQSPMHTPSAEGAVVYLNGNPDLGTSLSKVEAAGGKVAMPKTKISEDIGYMAFFIDSEGNKVGLHSKN